MSERVGTIYGVRFRDGPVCYVGQTRRKPQKRWHEHKTGKTPLSRALQMLGFDDWSFFIIEQVRIEDTNDRERHWIEHFDTLHPNGLNHKTGGCVSGLASEATKARISASVQAAFSSPEFRAWRSGAAKKVWAQHRNALISGLNADWAKPGRRAKHSEAMKRAMSDPDRRARVSAGMREHRRKLKEQRLASSSGA